MVNNAALAYGARKVETASPAELVLMLYEGAIKFCNIAMGAIEKKDYEKATTNIQTARRIVEAGVKEYVATLALGATTPSFDLEHPIDRTFPTDHITEEMVRQTLRRFEGEIMQVPPVYSACKVNGARAYDLARSGKGDEVELKAKPLRIDELELLDCNLPARELKLRVVCSKGTYIRALARDIGQALNSGAHLTALQRTRVGDYNLASAFSLDSFESWLAQQTIETELPQGGPADFTLST